VTSRHPETAKFRVPIAIPLAGLIAFISALPLATAEWYLAPILLVPLAIALWGWWAGTDADRDELRVRALIGRRRLRWAEVTALVPTGGRVVAVLLDGGQLTLTGVTPTDLPRLVTASGSQIEADEDGSDEIEDDGDIDGEDEDGIEVPEAKTPAQ
jgi:hypothetical protein